MTFAADVLMFSMIKSLLAAMSKPWTCFHRNRLTLLPLVLSLASPPPTENNNTTINNNNNSSSTEHESGSRDRDNGRDTEKDRSRGDKERERNPSSDHKANSTSPKRPTSREFPPEREKNWNYPPGLDNIALATGAFWQNYSGRFPSRALLLSRNRLTQHQPNIIPAINSREKRNGTKIYE